MLLESCPHDELADIAASLGMKKSKKISVSDVAFEIEAHISINKIDTLILEGLDKKNPTFHENDFISNYSRFINELRLANRRTLVLLAERFHLDFNKDNDDIELKEAIYECVIEFDRKYHDSAPEFDDVCYSPEYQANPAVLDDCPDSLELNECYDNSTNVIEQAESWVKVAEEIGCSLSHEQFIKGCLISRDYDAYRKNLRKKHKNYAALSGGDWLYKKYAPTLKSILDLAAFFGIEASSHKHLKRAVDKKCYLGHQLSDIIFGDIVCIYVRTYITINPPALPQELNDSVHEPEHPQNPIRTHRKRNVISHEDIYACNSQDEIRNLLSSLNMPQLKSLAKELRFSLVHLPRRNRKESIINSIAYRAYMTKCAQAKANHAPVGNGKQGVPFLSKFYIEMNENTGQLSFVFD